MMFFLKKGAYALVLLGLSVSLASCGDSRNFNEVSGLQGNYVNVPVSVPINPNGYGGVNRLDNGQVGSLNFLVDAQTGAIRGNYTVSSPVTTQSLEIDPRDYDIEGVVNLENGSYALGGSFGGEIGDFNVTGVLPLDGSATVPYELEVDGRVFEGQLLSGGSPSLPLE